MCYRRATALFLLVLGPALATVSPGRRLHAQKVVISGHDMALIAGATTGAALLSRYDVPIARTFSDSAFHLRHPGLTTAANRASMATETVYMVGGGLVWGIARLARDDGTADVALHTTESVVSAAMFIQLVRGALGRARPYVVDDEGERRDGDPYDFKYFHGFTSFNYRSFPSMHAMASFAVATALTQEMRVRNTPNRAIISPALYAAAAMPAVARMYLDEHWASDIALGMFLGVFSGQKAVQYSHAHPDNRIDRKFLRPTVTASVRLDGHGLSLLMLPF
jgi:membrane-associated phospholipid phosphatase